jgi:hypothetical protein
MDSALLLDTPVNAGATQAAPGLRRAAGEDVLVVIPTLNDTDDMLQALCRWVKENMGAETPFHFLRFFPQYRLRNLPPTPGPTLVRAREIARAVGLQYVYIGNLLALDQWYRRVRAGFMAGTPWGARCHAGAMQRLDEALRERVERLNAFVRIIGTDAEHACFPAGWDPVRERVAQALAARAGIGSPEALAPIVDSLAGATWTEAVQRLDADAAAVVRTWLKSIVSVIVDGPGKQGTGRME